MALETNTQLTTEETDDFLGRHETGVLSLARENRPYSIPISYGYESDARRFYLRLVSTPESEKRQFLSSSPVTRLAVYEEDDPLYWSVLATGKLEEVSLDELTVDHIEQYGRAKRPLFEIWAESRQDVDVQLYELRPEEVSGRRIEVKRES